MLTHKDRHTRTDRRALGAASHCSLVVLLIYSTIIRRRQTHDAKPRSAGGAVAATVPRAGSNVQDGVSDLAQSLCAWP